MPLERRLSLSHLTWRLRAIAKPPVTLGVRAMVLTPDQTVLLIRHTYMPGFHMPGGAVDPGESAIEAARREVHEEAGIAITAPGRLFHFYWNRGLAARDHVALYVFGGVARQDLSAHRSMEIAEAGFFPLDDLPGDVTEATRRRLREVVNGDAVCDEW